MAKKIKSLLNFYKTPKRVEVKTFLPIKENRMDSMEFVPTKILKPRKCKGYK
jgi:hypothetical protein